MNAWQLAQELRRIKNNHQLRANLDAATRAALESAATGLEQLADFVEQAAITPLEVGKNDDFARASQVERIETPIPSALIARAPASTATEKGN